jgi:hypothetical protein
MEGFSFFLSSRQTEQAAQVPPLVMPPVHLRTPSAWHCVSVSDHRKRLHPGLHVPWHPPSQEVSSTLQSTGGEWGACEPSTINKVVLITSHPFCFGYIKIKLCFHTISQNFDVWCPAALLLPPVVTRKEMFLGSLEPCFSLFCVFLEMGVSLCSPEWRVGVELMILLLLPSEFWDYSHAPQYLATIHLKSKSYGMRSLCVENCLKWVRHCKQNVVMLHLHSCKTTTH